MTDAARGPWEGMTIAGGRYQQLATLGLGGMGFIYRAIDGHLQAPVVIKSPRRALVEDAQHVSRFQREVGAMIKLSYPYIVPVIDVGQHDGLPFAVMRYMAGGNLDDRMQTDSAGRQLPMPSASLQTWLPTIAQALDFVHQQSYLHRDVKPSNILFDSHGHAYLSDFGIIKALGEQAEQRSSKLTGDGFMVGTIDYMAPELLTGQPVDGRSDQYALAATVYQVLSGHLPFEATTAALVIVQHVSQPPRPLSSLISGIPLAVCAAVLRGLAKKPAERFANCSEFADAVMQHAVDEKQRPAPVVAAAVRRATAVEPVPAIFPAHRATAVMPGPPQAAIPTTAPAKSTTPFHWTSRVGGLIALAVVGLGAVFLASTSSQDAGQYEVLESDPLPRMIVKWNERANQVEDALLIDSKPLREHPGYANADEFIKQIAGRAKQASPATQLQIDELSRDLAAMRTLYTQLYDRLRQRISTDASASSSEAGPRRQQLALEERSLKDQESKLKTMQLLLEELQSLQLASSAKKFDAGAIAEIAALREMEDAAAAKDRPQIATATLTRARELLDANNAQLSVLAMNVLARIGDSASLMTACDRLDRGQPDSQARLCISLLISKNAKSIAAVAEFLRDHPGVAQQLDLSRLLDCIDSDPTAYAPIVELVTALCTTADQRLRLARAQTKAMNDGWARDIEQACATGLLKSHVEELIVEIVAHRRKSSYTLARRLVEWFRQAKLEALSVDELRRTVDEDPALGSQLMKQLLLQGSGPRRAAAIEAFRTANVPFDANSLRDRIENEYVADPAGLLNSLLITDNARCLDLAEIVLEYSDGFDASRLDYHRVSKAALERKPIRLALANLALGAPEAGRTWADEQLLQPSFVDRFRKAEATSRRQLVDLKKITEVLNGKLKMIKGQANLAGTDRGLDIPTSELPHLKSELDSQLFGPEGKYEASLRSLLEELTDIRDSVDRRFAKDLSQIDAYLLQLIELTKAGRELGKVYDLTIVQQLPGARRELQKRQDLESWSFRYTRGNIETFQREMPNYETLEKQLASSRASLPAFLLKSPGPPSGKVSQSEGDSP